jgi:tetratricopeptide (TPR) repeat protein
LLIVALAACDRPRVEISPIPAPEVGNLEPSVRAALARARQDVDEKLKVDSDDAALAEAFGQLAMTYHTHGLAPQAEAAYRNAALLAPRDARWPYLLGQLCMDNARIAEAMGWFEAAHRVAPQDAAITFAIATTALRQGELDRAQRAFDELREHDATRPAALAGLGKVALARHDAATAIKLLEEVLRAVPGASRLRHPLAMAYRERGDTASAEANLKAFSPEGSEPGVPDPLAGALADKSFTSRSLIQRGQRYGRQGRFDLAAEAFQEAAKSNPSDPTLLVNLGIARANIGQLAEAEGALRRSLESDAANPTAQHYLGVVEDRLGKDDQAMLHYEAALHLEPANHEALLLLADAKMRTGQAGQAVKLYRAADAMRSTARVRLSLAFALAREARWSEARKLLESAMAAEPNDIGTANALVRVLAAAPDDNVRDGPRALAIAGQLARAVQDPEINTSLAMALAEVGRFDQAAALQRQVLEQGQPAPSADREFLEDNLRSYRQGQPVREPWPPTHLAFLPRSPTVSLHKP